VREVKVSGACFACRSPRTRGREDIGSPPPSTFIEREESDRSLIRRSLIRTVPGYVGELLFLLQSIAVAKHPRSEESNSDGR
jgi:hypothetical protein